MRARRRGSVRAVQQTPDAIEATCGMSSLFVTKKAIPFVPASPGTVLRPARARPSVQPVSSLFSQCHARRASQQSDRTLANHCRNENTITRFLTPIKTTLRCHKLNLIIIHNGQSVKIMCLTRA